MIAFCFFAFPCLIIAGFKSGPFNPINMPHCVNERKKILKAKGLS